jgi:hypothetical protein
MMSGILSIKALVAWVQEEDPDGSALAGTSSIGKALGKKTRELTKNVEAGRGFYLWGNYDSRGFWKNIYLGKAGYGKYAGLQKRITEELRDERCFLWIDVLSEKKILDKGAALFPAKWSQYSKEWQNRHFKKAGTSHIIWVATPAIDDSHVRNVEADLIETLNPIANVSRPTPPSELQEHTKEVIGHFRSQIHGNRPAPIMKGGKRQVKS